MTNIKMLHWLKAVKYLKIPTLTGACIQITKSYLNNSIISLIVRVNKSYISQLPKKQQVQAWAQIISSLHIGKTNEWLSAILKALNGWSKGKQWVCFTMFLESKLEKNIRVKGKNQLFPVGQSLSVFYTSQIKTSTNCKKKTFAWCRPVGTQICSSFRVQKNLRCFPRESLSSDQLQMTCSLPIRKHIWVGRYNKWAFGI